MDSAIISAIIALIGVVVTTTVAYLVSRSKMSRSDNIEMYRREMAEISRLREDTTQMRVEIMRLTEQLDVWKTKFYELQQENNRLQIRIEELVGIVNALKAALSGHE